MDNNDLISNSFVCVNHFLIGFIFLVFGIIFRLTIKLPELSSHLTASRIIISLLNTLNLSSDMISHIVKYLLQNPIENQSVSKSITNFEDID
jgi:hypothetical protein